MSLVGLIIIQAGRARAQLSELTADFQEFYPMSLLPINTISMKAVKCKYYQVSYDCTAVFFTVTGQMLCNCIYNVH